MLVACRLAGLSALITDYAGGVAVAQPSATATAETATGRPSLAVSALASRVQPVGWRVRLLVVKIRRRSPADS